MKAREWKLLREIPLFLLLAALYIYLPRKGLAALPLAIILFRVLARISGLWCKKWLSLHCSTSVHFGVLHRPFDIELQIENPCPFRITGLFIEVKQQGLSILSDQTMQISLAARERRTISLRAVGDQRGIHSLGPFILTGKDPLEVFQWTKEIDRGQKVVIYPSIFSIYNSPSRGISGGNLPVNNPLYENLNSFQALRKYQPGDELKRINWKASARMGDLHCNVYDSTLYFPVQIILNLSEQEYPLNQRLDLQEKAVGAAASLGLYYLGLKQSVGLICSGDSSQGQEDSRNYRWLPQATGPHQASLLLYELASLRLSKENPGLRSLFSRRENTIDRGTKYLIITPPPLAEDLAFLREQKRRGLDLELFLLSGLRTHRKQLNPRGIPCFILSTQGGGLAKA